MVPAPYDRSNLLRLLGTCALASYRDVSSSGDDNQIKSLIVCMIFPFFDLPLLQGVLSSPRVDSDDIRASLSL